jgi:hypothetical protein
MKKKYLIIFIFTSFLLISDSCKEKTSIESEWKGKEVLFPEYFECGYAETDTLKSVCSDLLEKEYKILIYIDSLGCTSCKFRIFEWEHIIEEANHLYGNKLSFLFFVSINHKKELQKTLKRYKFFYPVFFDNENEIMRLNSLPKKVKYQCFLLDKDNKVLSVGNPVYDPKIWKRYKKIISKKDKIKYQ